MSGTAMVRDADIWNEPKVYTAMILLNRIIIFCYSTGQESKPRTGKHTKKGFRQNCNQGTNWVCKAIYLYTVVFLFITYLIRYYLNSILCSFVLKKSNLCSITHNYFLFDHPFSFFFFVPFLTHVYTATFWRHCMVLLLCCHVKK